MLRMISIVLLIACSRTIAQEIPLTGIVLSLDNTPLQGVNVVMIKTGRGTATDMNGNFLIMVPKGEVVLLFAHMKQKSIEHFIDVQPGLQYQVHVIMANKSQTFHKSNAVTGTLSIDAPVIRGKVVDQNGAVLAGVHVSQDNNAFQTMTDSNGIFTLPVADGERLVAFRYRGTKELQSKIITEQGSIYDLDVVLVEDSPRYRHQTSSVRVVAEH